MYLSKLGKHMARPYSTTDPELDSKIFHPAPLATLHAGKGAHFVIEFGIPTRAVQLYGFVNSSDLDLTDEKLHELLARCV